MTPAIEAPVSPGANSAKSLASTPVTSSSKVTAKSTLAACVGLALLVVMETTDGNATSAEASGASIEGRLTVSTLRHSSGSMRRRRREKGPRDLVAPWVRQKKYFKPADPSRQIPICLRSRGVDLVVQIAAVDHATIRRPSAPGESCENSLSRNAAAGVAPHGAAEKLLRPVAARRNRRFWRAQKIGRQPPAARPYRLRNR